MSAMASATAAGSFGIVLKHLDPVGPAVYARRSGCRRSPDLVAVVEVGDEPTPMYPVAPVTSKRIPSVLLIGWGAVASAQALVASVGCRRSSIPPTAVGWLTIDCAAMTR